MMTTRHMKNPAAMSPLARAIFDASLAADHLRADMRSGAFFGLRPQPKVPCPACNGSKGQMVGSRDSGPNRDPSQDNASGSGDGGYGGQSYRPCYYCEGVGEMTPQAIAEREAAKRAAVEGMDARRAAYLAEEDEP